MFKCWLAHRASSSALVSAALRNSGNSRSGVIELDEADVPSGAAFVPKPYATNHVTKMLQEATGQVGA